jgi:hypothetical protein
VNVPDLIKQLLKDYDESNNEMKFMQAFGRHLPALNRIAYPERYQDNDKSTGAASDSKPEAADKQAAVPAQPQRPGAYGRSKSNEPKDS